MTDEKAIQKIRSPKKEGPSVIEMAWLKLAVIASVGNVISVRWLCTENKMSIDDNTPNSLSFRLFLEIL
jgi:hypothetical protein